MCLVSSNLYSVGVMVNIMSNKLNKRAVFTNTVWQVVVRVIAIVLALVSVKLLATYLGADGVGEYNTITTYINFFIVFADLGLFSVAVREISKKPEDESKIISNVLVIRIISALVASAVAVFIVFLTNYNQNIKIGTLIATGFLIFNLLGSVYDAILQYRLKMQYSAIAELVSKGISVLALYLIILNRGSFLWIVSTITLSGIIIFLMKWLFARQFVKPLRKYEFGIIKTIFAMAWPLGLVFIVNNLFFKLDTLMLYAIKGATAVGIYSVSYKVLEVTVFAGAYFSSALKPTISSHIANNKEYISGIVSKSITIMLLISLPITLMCVLFAREIILFLSSQEFILGSTALIILSFTLPLIYLDTLLGEILVANDEKKLLIRIALGILAFNLILNLILIPLYSFKAAAVTTLLSELLLLIINYHYTQKIVKYSINFGSIAKLIAIFVLTYAIMILFRNPGIHFIIQILITFTIYSSLVAMFKIVTKESILSLIKPNGVS